MKRLVLAALAAAPLLAAAQDASPVGAPQPADSAGTPAEPVREGVYLGIGLGDTALFSQDQGLVAYRIRLGMTRSPRLQFGLEIQHAERGGEEIEFTDVSATFFPWSRIFFVRGGFGVSSIVRTKYVYAGPGLSYTTATGGNGVNLLGGLGAQLGRSNGINFTLNVEGQAHRIHGLLSDVHDSEATLSLWLGLEWH